MSINIYNQNIPQADDDLDVSQGDILRNFSSLDSIFGKDHVEYSSRSTDQGLHTSVTSVEQDSHPSTEEDRPKIYGFKPNDAVGVIEYTRQGNDAMFSPLARKQSSQSAFTMSGESTLSILNLSSLNNFMVELIVSAGSGSNVTMFKALVVKNEGGTLIRFPLAQASTPTFTADVTSAGVIRLRTLTGSSVNNIRWTAEFIRME